MFEGARWTRTVVMVEGGFLFIDHVRADRPGRIDRPIHLAFRDSPPELTASVQLEPTPGPLGESGQYRAAVGEDKDEPVFLRGGTDETWTIDAKITGKLRARVTVLGEKGTEVARVRSLDLGWGHRMPFYLARRDGVRETDYVVFIEPHGEEVPPRLRGIRRLEVKPAAARAVAFALVFDETEYRFLLNHGPGEARCGGLETAERIVWRVQPTEP
jgi:hypothetical protein